MRYEIQPYNGKWAVYDKTLNRISRYGLSETEAHTLCERANRGEFN